MKIYGNMLSSNVRRVAITAKELGVAHEFVSLDFMTGDMQKPEYLAKNPMGKVPTFQDEDGWILWESPAIMIHLAKKAGRLYPSDLRGESDALRWLFWNASHFEPAIFAVANERIIKPQFRKEKTDEARVASATKDFERYGAILDAHLAIGPWVLGDGFSIVDIALGATVDFGTAAGLDPDAKNMRHVARWLTRLRERPSWKVG